MLSSECISMIKCRQVTALQAVTELEEKFLWTWERITKPAVLVQMKKVLLGALVLVSHLLEQCMRKDALIKKSQNLRALASKER